MERRSLRERMRRTIDSLKRLLKREGPDLPDDPYAMVTAPKKPRPPHRSAAVADEPER
jgi:alkanesulfonate monooxygenase SsuD/methylene tetrahydromethanopterin reductase-like flavin-dependent oxidoreductase (luciferase family)